MPQIPDYGAENRPAASLGRLVRTAGMASLSVVACTPVDGISPQTDAITFTAPGNSAVFSIDIVRGSVSRTISITTDADATAAEAATALAAAVNADALSAGLVSAAAAAGVATLTWRKGITGTVALALNPGTAAALVTTAAASVQYRYGHAVELVELTNSVPNFHQEGCQRPSGSGTRFGIVYDDHITAPEGVETVIGPKPGTPVSVIRSNGNGNVVAVATGEAVDAGDPVYVGSTGAEKDLLYKQSGSGRVLFPGALFTSTVAAAGVGHIQL